MRISTSTRINRYASLLFLILVQGLMSNALSQQGNSYASKYIFQDSVEVSFYSPTMFRFRISHGKGEHIPQQYEIPFAIGKTTNWEPVPFQHFNFPSHVSLVTDSIELRISKLGLNWEVFRKSNGEQIHPSSGPVYGMFRNGYTVFDNVSAFDAPTKINRYSHWFYNPITKNYTDTYLEEDLIEDKYFIYGPSYTALFAQMNELIGPEPLLPKKGYGFFQTQHMSCEGTQAQLMDVVKKFRDRKIPLDNLIIDFEWGDGCDDEKEVTWGSRLDWNKKYSTPLSPKEMVAQLKKQHVDVMLIHHSAGKFDNRKHQGWTETEYDETTWWNKYKEKLDFGIRGTWQDTRINDITDSYIYQRTQQYYGNSKRVLFLGSRKVMAFNPWDFRFSTMPTENMIGARRYPFHWTEDCSFSWNEMAFQLKAINNTWGSMSGYSYLASDGIGSNWKIQARWSQFTALSAIARSHNSKPWSGNIDLNDFTNKIKIRGRDSVKIKSQSDTEQNETAEASIRKYLQLRYRLLPYIYSYAINNYLTGMPITRPMLLAFPNDYMCSSDTWPYQFMLGENILVAPVYGDFKSMEIYLPKGFDWIDFESGDEYNDGGIIAYNTEDINKLPLFIKKGAIIPMRQSSNWIDIKETDSLTVEVYPSEKFTEYILYEDDGESIEYQSGRYGEARLTCRKSNDNIQFCVMPMKGEYFGKPKSRTMVFGFNKVFSEPRAISLNGKHLAVFNSGKSGNDYWKYDKTLARVTLRVSVYSDQATIISIR